MDNRHIQPQEPNDQGTCSQAEAADSLAPIYDDYTRKHRWRCPEKLFSMMEGLFQPGQVLLDLGIGTGQSAQPFRREGMIVYGLDHSPKMLEICRGKGIAFHLQQVDLNTARLPFPDCLFDLVLASGVFHLLPLSEPLIRESKRILRPGGHIAFTFDPWNPDSPEEYLPVSLAGVHAKINRESGVCSYRHTVDSLLALLMKNGFRILKGETFIAFRSPEDQRPIRFCAWILQATR